MLGGIGKAHGGVHRLTERAIKTFLARGAEGKLSDGGGMFLTTTAAGTPVWRVKYRLAGKELLYSIGQYPVVTLERARHELAWVKEQLREGKDPVQARALTRSAAVAAADMTFRAVFDQWLEKQRPGWSDIHFEKSKRAIERDVLPALGALPITAITPPHVATAISAVDGRGARDTAGKILQHLNGIFRYAQAKGLRTDNPAAPVGEILSRRSSVGRRPALLKWAELGAVLRAAEAANLSRSVRQAHRLCAFTAARISNIVQAEWPEFDLEAMPPTWIIPRSKMKVGGRPHDHKIILGPTIAAELRAWRAITSPAGYLFPSPAGGAYISRESVEKAYRVTLQLDGKHTPHGWRSAFSTLGRDQGFAREVVELTLDHIHDNDIARAYDRGERLTQRVELMTWWDAQLAAAERGAEVLPLRAATR
jgi:integrase